MGWAMGIKARWAVRVFGRTIVGPFEWVGGLGKFSGGLKSGWAVRVYGRAVNAVAMGVLGGCTIVISGGFWVGYIVGGYWIGGIGWV